MYVGALACKRTHLIVVQLAAIAVACVHEDLQNIIVLRRTTTWATESRGGGGGREGSRELASPYLHFWLGTARFNDFAEEAHELLPGAVALAGR